MRGTGRSLRKGGRGGEREKTWARTVGSGGVKRELFARMAGKKVRSANA